METLRMIQIFCTLGVMLLSLIVPILQDLKAEKNQKESGEN